MPLTKNQKTDLVAELQAEFAQIRNAVLIDYLGLNVDQVNLLRDKVRESEGKYRVVKNTLARLAVEGTPLEGLKDHLTGPTAIAYHAESTVELAKVMTDFVKDHQKIVEIRAGVMDGNVATREVVEQFASMPTKEDLQAKLVFLLQSPLQRTVTLMQVVQRNLVVVLQEGAKKKDDE